MNDIKTFLLTIIILFSGCNFPRTPQDQYKNWIVTATSNGGVIREYYVKSVNQPIIEYGWNTTRVYSYNEKPTPFENERLLILTLPEGWLIETKEVYE